MLCNNRETSQAILYKTNALGKCKKQSSEFIKIIITKIIFYQNHHFKNKFRKHAINSLFVISKILALI